MLTKILHFIKNKIISEKTEYKEFFSLNKDKNITLVIQEETLVCRYYDLSFTGNSIVVFKKFKNANAFSVKYKQLCIIEENENEIVLFVENI